MINFNCDGGDFSNQELTAEIEKTSSEIAKIKLDREEKWLSECMEKIMPESVFSVVKTDLNRVGRWLRRRKITINEFPDGTKTLMRGGFVISTLPPIDIAFKQ